MVVVAWSSRPISGNSCRQFTYCFADYTHGGKYPHGLTIRPKTWTAHRRRALVSGSALSNLAPWRSLGAFKGSATKANFGKCCLTAFSKVWPQICKTMQSVVAASPFQRAQAAASREHSDLRRRVGGGCLGRSPRPRRRLSRWAVYYYYYYYYYYY